MADVALENPPIHYRSIFLFLFYLSLILSLAFTCCRTIYVRYQARQKNNDWATGRRTHLWLFIFLAAMSLGSTWYYMISLFIRTYDDWAASPQGIPYAGKDTPLITRLGLWLYNTYIFQTAWETVSETPARVWWSGQIFGWTIGWSLFLGVMGRRYRIPHIWVFMLLAQAVAVSFSANLFFAAVAVSSRVDEKTLAFAWSPPLLYEAVPVALSLLDTLAVPIFAYQKEFMLILLAPHFLVFIPTLLGPGPKDSSEPTTKAQGARATRRYVVLMQWVAAASVVLQAYFTFLARRELGTELSFGEFARKLWDTVYVHPACSSVSWDAIMSAVSAFFWALVHGFDSRRMVGGL
ncbi:uncharacterized protein DSM5745_07545 [Aspergillus mulundensis]|uniref:Uncharacterized protein n=1 Tax=Aspergillus mulundensis TaxID=1810919 RepID=A0A3D8RE77_9EURO|nr:Uncharacterized protein DSM5745_07545 [Aspergillus mulundensis]RDW72373.1 Uncharacterized protein DSM5745_07545 [Aspergillus mulundensis]